MSFYTDIIQKDPRFHGIESCRDMALLEPVFRAAIEAIIADAAKLDPPIELRVTETYRSQARQHRLFLDNKTQLSKVGVHGYGLAADFCKIVGGQARWDGDWTFLRDLAVKHGCISGVDWGQPGVTHSFIDSDHVQRVAVHDQERLFAGDWYPDENYRPSPEVVT